MACFQKTPQIESAHDKRPSDNFLMTDIFFNSCVIWFFGVQIKKVDDEWIFLKDFRM